MKIRREVPNNLIKCVPQKRRLLTRFLQKQIKPTEEPINKRLCLLSMALPCSMACSTLRRLALILYKQN